MTDQALIMRMANGDGDACRALYARWAPAIRAYSASRLWWRPTDDDDVVQEVMLRVWRAAPRYVPQHNDGRRWIWQIVRNLVRDWAAANQRRMRCYEGLARGTDSTSVAPNQDLEDEDVAAALWNHIDRSGRLTHRQRECFHAMLNNRGRPLACLALDHGMNVNTFKGHCWRGRLAARRALADRPELPLWPARTTARRA